MKSRSASKIKLTSYDDLLGGTAALEDIREVAIDELHSFAGHPFKVKDDEEMKELVESVKAQGILTALLVRPLKKADTRLFPAIEENMLLNWLDWSKSLLLSGRWTMILLSGQW